MIDLVALVRGVLAELDPDLLVRRVLAQGLPWPCEDGLVIVAMGKAATPMFEGARAALLESSADVRVRGACVVHPVDTAAPSAPGLHRPGSFGHSSIAAPHPLPDARSVRAARTIVKLVGHGLPVLVLLSGGASSLVAWPVRGLALEKKRSIVASLLESGAPIDDVNLVRRHLSRIKGGGLLRAAWPSPVHTLLISDVLSKRASDVGSGPSMPTARGLRAARLVARRWLGDTVANALPLEACVGPDDAEAQGATHSVLASPGRLAQRVARELSKRGYATDVGPPARGDLDATATELLARARGLAPRTAYVIAAEPTLRWPSHGSMRAPMGKGGRASHLALMLGPRLPRGVSALCLATDGADGSSGHAGALVTRARFVGRAAETRAAIAAFDSGSYVLKLGAAVELPKGHNLTDLVVLTCDDR